MQPMANWLASALPVAACGVIWIWRYQHHSTACDDTDSASDGRLLAFKFYDQFIKDYRGSQVPEHWCFYEKTGEREGERYWRHDNNDGDISTTDAGKN